MRVLLTGGSGYIGGRLAKFLMSQNDVEVIIGTRSETSCLTWLPEAKVLSLNYANSDNLAAACQGLDTVVHLAAVDENYSMECPAESVMINTCNTVRLLEAARNNGVKRFIFLSTAHVYGAPLEGDISEDTCPFPRHPYAISHRAAEDFVLAAFESGSIEGIVVRLSNGFGAPAHEKVNRWTLLVNDLCRQAVTEQQLTLKTSGSQQRDFVTLHDASRAINHLLRLDVTSFGNGIFNVGGDWTPTILEMANLVAKRCEHVLGYEVSINRPTSDQRPESNELIFKIDKLLNSGFALEKNHQSEIDSTLKFCLEFKKS